MTDDSSNLKSSSREPWPLAATVIASLAVAATVGVALVIYVIAVSGELRARLIAVLPIYFIAAFFSVLVVFWALHALVAWAKAELGLHGMGTREHAVVVGLTFLAVSLIHYTQAPAVQRLLQEQGTPQAQAGTCPEATDCLPPRPAAELKAASADERREFARRGRLTAQGLAILVADADPGVRAVLAGRRDLPEEVRERLAGDRAAAVRAAAAASPRLSDEALTRLAFDREESVRLAVARNRNAPPTALDGLAGSPSGEVRELVAGHPRASEPVLRRLLNGSGDRAEKLARERLGRGNR